MPLLRKYSLLLRAVIGNEPLHAVLAVEEHVGRPGRNHGVDVAVEQQFAKALVRHAGQPEARRQRELRHLLAAGVVDPGLDPLDRRERHAGVVLEPAAHVGHRGLRPLRNADPLAREVGGAADRRIGADEDRAVPEHAGRKHRQPDHRRIALGQQRAIGGEREFRQLPLVGGQEAIGDGLERMVEHREPDALRLDLAGRKLARVQVVADGERERKVRHGRIRDWRGAGIGCRKRQSV